MNSKKKNFIKCQFCFFSPNFFTSLRMSNFFLFLFFTIFQMKKQTFALRNWENCVNNAKSKGWWFDRQSFTFAFCWVSDCKSFSWDSNSVLFPLLKNRLMMLNTATLFLMSKLLSWTLNNDKKRFSLLNENLFAIFIWNFYYNFHRRVQKISHLVLFVSYD